MCYVEVKSTSRFNTFKQKQGLKKVSLFAILSFFGQKEQFWCSVFFFENKEKPCFLDFFCVSHF